VLEYDTGFCPPVAVPARLESLLTHVFCHEKVEMKVGGAGAQRLLKDLPDEPRQFSVTREATE